MRYFRTQHSTADGYLAVSRADIITTLASINSDTLVYIDDLYAIIAATTDRLSSMYLTVPDPIVQTDMLTSALFMDRHQYVKNHADRHYAALPECYERSNTTVQTLYDHADTLSQRIAQVDAMLENMQVLVTNNNTSSSIYDEVIVYDTCDQFSMLSSGTLFRDVHAGCLVLPVVDATAMPFTVESVVVNDQKGTLTIPAFGVESYAWLPTGVMTTPMVGDQPVFETDSDASVTYLTDGNPLTMVYRERLSKTPMNPLVMDVTLSGKAQDIDALRIICANIGSDAKTNDTTYPLTISDCLVKYAGSSSFVSLMTNAIDNRISINGKSVGTCVTDIVNVAGDSYPGAVLYLGAKNIVAIKLRIVHARSHIAVFKEKILADASGQILHTFNYPETLFINGYIDDGKHPSPASWYADDVKARIQQLLTSASSTSDEERIVYRNAIGLRELSLLKCMYTPSGETQSVNLNNTGKAISACELYTSQIVPDGCKITYYISTDLDQWYPIAPKNHPYTDTDVLRLVFDDRLPTVAHDHLLPRATSTLYIKVSMTGTSSVTPLLKAFAVRIKHL